MYSSLAVIVSDRGRYIEKVEEFLQFEFLLYDSFFLRTYGGERLRSLWEHCEQHPNFTKGVLERELLLTNGFPMYLGFDLSKKMSHHFCGFPGSGSDGLGFKQFVFNQKTKNFELLDSVPEEENSPYIVMGELFPNLSPETLLGIVINKENGWKKPNHIVKYENVLKEIRDNLEPLIDNFVDTSIQKFLQTVSFLDFNKKIKQKFVKLIELYNQDAKKENHYFLKEDSSLAYFLLTNLNLSGELVSELAFEEFEKVYSQSSSMPIIYNLQTKQLELITEFTYVKILENEIRYRYYHNNFPLFNGDLFFDGADFDPKYHIVDLLVALYTEIITEEEFQRGK